MSFKRKLLSLSSSSADPFNLQKIVPKTTNILLTIIEGGEKGVPKE